jgi:hypothetical protein
MPIPHMALHLIYVSCPVFALGERTLLLHSMDELLMTQKIRFAAELGFAVVAIALVIRKTMLGCLLLFRSIAGSASASAACRRSRGIVFMVHLVQQERRRKLNIALGQ